MANIKISQLPAASAITPGTDVVPIVHLGSTEKATPNQIVNEVLKAPGAIGGTTPAAGSFTTLNASSAATINGTSIPTSKTLADTASVQTLTNKSMNFANNTFTGTLAQFNAACSDADFSTTNGIETLTNKTVNLANNTVSGTLAQFNTACSDADFASVASTQTLSNKTLDTTCTLDSVKIGSAGVLLDVNGNQVLRFAAQASAVNRLIISNAATGNNPYISAAGSDANINVAYVAKGTGYIWNLSPVLGDYYIKSKHPTDGVGYATGAGGTVAQATNRTTAVTINKICGQITTVSATATAGAFVTFTVNNSAVAATDTVVACLAGSTFSGKYILDVVDVAAGSFKIQTYTPAAVVSSEALVINFSVIKAVNA